MNPTNLKTAEEWMNEKGFTTQEQLRSGGVLIGNKRKVTILDSKDIEQIQLNAYRAGMTEAAEIVRKQPYQSADGHALCAEEIETARDRKESL